MFSGLVLQDAETLNLVEDSAMLRQLGRCLEDESGHSVHHSQGARAQSSALAAAERCKSLSQAAEPWRECACVLFTVCW